MRTFLAVAISVFVILALVALFAGESIAAALSFGGNEGTPVRIETVKRSTLTESVSAPGIVEPKLKVDVSAEVSARIVELPIREGSRVRAGDLIMRLDDRILKAALQSDEARRDGERYRLEAERSRIVGTQNTLDSARATAQRQEQLFRTGDISRQAYEDAVTRVRDFESQFQAQKNTITQLEKSLAAAESQIEQQRELLRKTIVVAAIDGVITQLNAEVGELVVVGTMNNPGTKILTIADLSQMKLTAKISESDVPRVAPGQPTEVRINGYKNRVFKGVVEQVALQSTMEKDGTGYFESAIALDLGGELVFSGLGGNVDISIATHEGLVLPSQAIVQRKIEDLPSSIRSSPLIQTGRKTTSVVFRMKDGRAIATPVQTGPSNLTDTVVLDGIAEGDVVITGPYKALERLKELDQVKQDEAGAAAADAAADAESKGKVGVRVR
ncbi:MAG: efflux RND transporter periplasmic adaptor subunit [Phycisphaerae bacterium]|nr:efflux RND transporter periplasmic adaptor subunit [Phycisphaerae bacterium]